MWFATRSAGKRQLNINNSYEAWGAMPQVLGKDTIMEAIDTIKEILNSNLGIDPETIDEDTTFASLDIDSLDMTELTCELEDQTGKELTGLEQVTTVGELAELVESL